MKRLFTLLGSIGFVIAYSQNITVPPTNITTTENYVFSRTYLEPTATSNTSTKQVQSVSYFDGLGRPKQSIAIKATTSGKDLVTTIPYDGFGRQIDSWLPASMSTLNGGIQSGVESAVSTTHNNDPNPFSHKDLENSPLDRINAQINPGTDWANKPVTFGYETNIGTEVKRYTNSTSWSNGATLSSLSQTANYGANQLYKNTVTDEDGNLSIEYKNGEGQTILVRKNDGNTDVDTYYVYNDYNQLAFVIPPLAAAKTTLSIPDLDNLCYQYRYDGRNRLVEKKLPGKGWEYMIYDKQDRLVATQDALLKSANQWLFTKYDQFGRVVYTGMYVNPSQRAALQNSLDANSNPQNNEIRATTPTTYSGIALYYTNTAFPVITASSKLLSVNYYDSYPTGTPPFNNILGQSPSPTLLTSTYTTYGNSVRSTKGLPTASFVNNIDANGWTKNYTFYDIKARPIGTYSFNYLGGYTKTESLLDFAGVPQKTFTYHKRLSVDAEIKIKERFEYNQYTNALVKHYHEVVGKSPEVLLTENTYNEIGQLTNKKVGNNIQSIDYAYNIRGWLTGVNNPKILNGKLFGFTINYQSPLEITNTSPYSSNTGLTVEKKFNGNISEVTWASGDTPTPLLKKYGYVYDKLNRLLAGFYYTGSQYTYNSENFEILNYDKNGNISDLKRTSFFGNTTSNLIDDLSYNYQNGNGNSNRLISITDIPNASGYEGGGGTISYDDNGNMIDMPDKGISAIAYNFLNLPNQMNIQEGGISDITINTIYRADGTKLRKTNTTITTGVAGNATIVSKTDYVDGFQYLENTKSGNLNEAAFADLEISMSMEREAFSREAIAKPVPGVPAGNNFILQFVPTSEGFYDFKENKYIYQYKDHLGNTRLSYAWNTTTNSIDVLDKNDYYPFGMNHLDSNAGSFVGESSYKNYKYNGKELQETGMYDYGARMYMPDIGRFGAQDALGEMYYSYSPYGYVANNPIKFIDPTGMWIDIKDGDNTYRYNDGKLYTQNAETKKWDVEASVTGDSYAGQILSSLTSITGGDKDSFGSTFLGLFSNDKINTTIQSSTGTNFEGQNGAYTDGSGIVTAFNQEVKPYTSMSGERSQQTQNPFYVTLFHEIGHSFLNQTSSRSELGKSWVDGVRNGLPKDISQAEIAASYMENLLRSEQGLPIRTSYSPDAQSASTLVDAKSIKWQPTIRSTGPGNSKINLNTRVFTMPNSVQVIYNKIMNSKK